MSIVKSLTQLYLPIVITSQYGPSKFYFREDKKKHTLKIRGYIYVHLSKEDIMHIGRGPASVED